MKADEDQVGFTKSMLRSNFVGILVVLWMIGLAADDGIGTFIHILYAAALAVLTVCLGQEVILNRRLRRAFRDRPYSHPVYRPGEPQNDRDPDRHHDRPPAPTVRPGWEGSGGPSDHRHFPRCFKTSSRFLRASALPGLSSSTRRKWEAAASASPRFARATPRLK